MNEEPVSDSLLRQFLLGKIDDQERQRLEILFVTGALSKERVMAAEQHLLDDFLEDSLTPEDKERFLAQYGETPAEQRKLRIAKSIQLWATAGEQVNVSSAAGSIWSRLRSSLRVKPVFVIPVAAVSIIAIVLALVWVNGKWQQRNRHLAMQQELVRLNAPGVLRDVSPPGPPFALTPGAVRSAESENEITPQANAEFVELHLVWRQKERYASYQATISRSGTNESFTIPNLQIENVGTIR